MRKTIDERTRKLIVNARLKLKLKRDKVAELYDVCDKSVTAIVQHYKKTGTYSVGKRGGARNFKDYSAEVKETEALLKENLELTNEEISKIWKRKFKISLTPNGVRLILKENGVETNSNKRKRASETVKSKKEVIASKDFVVDKVSRKSMKRALRKGKNLNYRIARRFRTVLDLHRGETPENIAKRESVSVSSVYTWKNLYLKGGEQALRELGYKRNGG